MDNEVLDRMTAAIEKAKEKLNQASYLSESGSNPGLRQLNANKADWLHWVVYLAERGFEYEKYLSEPTVAAVEEAPKTDYQKALMLFQMIKDNPIN